MSNNSKKNENSFPKIAIFVVAYNAASTLIGVLKRIPTDVYEKISEVFVFDDFSSDETYEKGRRYILEKSDEKIHIFKNIQNFGYGGNQKKGYDYAISMGYDYVILLHGDGQYAPEVLPDMLNPIFQNKAEVVFGSRMMKKGEARKGGMPLYKYLGNKILTSFENKMLGMNLSEFHSGYRIYSTRLLRKIPYHKNTDDFHFDTEIIIQINRLGEKIIEVPIPTYYGDEICYVNGIKYAKNIFKTVFQSLLHDMNISFFDKFNLGGKTYVYKKEKYSSHERILSQVMPDSRVLDVGSASGYISRECKNKKCHVIGTDIIEPTDYSYFDEFRVANLENGLPTNKDEYFDYIIFGDVIEHVLNAKKILQEAKEHLAQHGKVIISTGNVANWFIRFNLLFGRFQYTKKGILDSTHVHLYTKKSLRRFLERCGFSIETIDVTIIPYELAFTFLKNYYALAFLRNVSYFIAKIFPGMFSYQFVVVAK